MSSAFKTLLTSDFAVVPYRALKSYEYTSCSIHDARFKIFKGVNVPQSVTGSLPSEAIYYSSVKNLYYAYHITASLDSGSANYDFEQSTASSGSLQSDQRYFPTGSEATVKIVSIPQTIYGEAIHPRTFKLKSDTDAYYVVDDGNGNLVDLVDCLNKKYNGSYSLNGYNFSEIYNTELLYDCARTGSLVGNIIYPQGILIITNPDYDCLFDLGPTTSDVYAVFFTTDTPKTITPLITATTDCSAIAPDTLELYPITGEQFPTYSLNNGTIQLDTLDPLTTTEGTYIINYGVNSVACSTSNTSSIYVTIIDCALSGGVITVGLTPTPTTTPTPTRTLTPTPTRTLTPTPTNTITPTYTPSSTRTPAVTPSVTPTKTTTPTLTPSITPTKTNTPTSTPTPTQQNIVPLYICAYPTPGDPYFVTYKVFTVGDLNSNPVDTDVTVEFTGITLGENTFNYTFTPAIATIAAGNYTSTESTIRGDEYSGTIITSVESVYTNTAGPFAMVITQSGASPSGQVYIYAGLCPDIACASCLN